jgi:serine/threonine protein kinase
VLEYVEVEILQARLSKGALPLEDALALCRQIAEGLKAAHKKGVMHRDM